MSTGKMLIIMGVILVLAGLAVTFWQKIPILGKLPGDIYFEKGNFRFYFPLMTSILLSLILTLVSRLISRLFR